MKSVSVEERIMAMEKEKRENVIFINKGMRYCTCGHVSKNNFTYACPECETRHKEYFTNRNPNRPVYITGLIYYDLEDVDEKSFTLKRYDLIYMIEESKKRVKTFIREYGSLNYNFDDDEIYCKIYRDKKKHSPSDLLKYKQRHFTTINDDSVRDKISKCIYFYERTGYKELCDIYKKNFGLGWIRIHKFIDFLEYHKENREFELLVKAGFENASMDTFLNKTPLSKGTRLGDVIKLPKSIVKLIKQDYSYKDLKILEFLHVNGGGLTQEAIDYIERLHDNRHPLYLLSHIKELVKHGYKLIELFDYLERADMYQAVEPSQALRLLSDYVNMALNMKVPYKKFPNSLKKEHDLMARRYKFAENKIYEDKLKEKINENKHLAYEKDEFSIVLPEDTTDLVREGSTLHHCVASYIKRIVSGDCFIVFLRQTNQKEKPFYTIEVRDGKVVQARGYANKKLTDPKAKAFLKEWGKRNDIQVIAM